MYVLKCKRKRTKMRKIILMGRWKWPISEPVAYLRKKKSIWTGPKHWLNNLKNIFFLLGAKLKRCQHQIMATKIVMIRAELYGGKNMKWFDYHWSWHQTQIARSYVKCYQPVLRPYELFIQIDIFIFMWKNVNCFFVSLLAHW